MKLLISCLFFIFSTAVFGQKPKLKTATMQEWSGGIAGRHGKNYTFGLEFNNSRKPIVPDSIWLDGQAISIASTNASNRAVVRVVTNKTYGKTNWLITIKLSYDSHPTEYNEADLAVRPPVKFNGSALIRYRVANATRYFVVKKVTTILPPISYP